MFQATDVDDFLPYVTMGSEEPLTDALSTVTLITSSISGSSTTITSSGHGFKTGDKILYTAAGTAVTGLTNGTSYYAKVVDANTFSLASSTPFWRVAKGSEPLRRSAAALADVLIAASFNESVIDLPSSLLAAF